MCNLLVSVCVGVRHTEKVCAIFVLVSNRVLLFHLLLASKINISSSHKKRVGRRTRNFISFAMIHEPHSRRRVTTRWRSSVLLLFIFVMRCHQLASLAAFHLADNVNYRRRQSQVDC